MKGYQIIEVEGGEEQNESPMLNSVQEAYNQKKDMIDFNHREMPGYRPDYLLRFYPDKDDLNTYADYKFYIRHKKFFFKRVW